MSIVKVFDGTVEAGARIAREAAERLDYSLIDDDQITARIESEFGIHAKHFQRTLRGGKSAFDHFTHESDQHRTRLKLLLGEILQSDRLLLYGRFTQVIPADIPHVLRVCLVSDLPHRIRAAQESMGLSPKEAERRVLRDNEQLKKWSLFACGEDPWDASLYDLFLPVGKASSEEAVELICRNAADLVLQPNERSIERVKDFLLGARVELEIQKAGHQAGVVSRDGQITITIERHTIMLSKLEEELRDIAKQVEGVRGVTCTVGPGFYQPGLYWRFNGELPNRVLLVDDEVEFVQTLSDRLKMREMGSAVVHDGEQALTFAEEEEPDVIVLDLKMPGIDGVEVLRRLKAKKPSIEVIILTGHGSEKDREACLDLGAFAYLQKPVDINVLSRKVKDAYEKVKAGGDHDS